MSKESIIDIKRGDIYGKGKEETVILKGEYLHENNNYVERATIVIKDENSNIEEYPLKLKGYNIKIFLGKFSSDNSDDIYIYGETDNLGGYPISLIYKYDNGKIVEIFNSQDFSENHKCTSRYLDGYKIEILCESYERKYILDITNVDKNYLKQIYGRDGNVKVNENPNVSCINRVDLIYDLENELINLLVYQKILGINMSNVLGEIDSLISLKNDESKILNKYVTNGGGDISIVTRANDIKEEILDKLPDDTILINLNKFGGSNGLINKDIDGDGNNEIICGYKSKDTQYISVFREVEGVIKHLDTIVGEGYDISDLVITKLRSKSNNNILIGWSIGSICSVLDIVEFKENKFNKLLRGDKIKYSKVEVVEFDDKRSGVSDIVLWTHETGEAYKVQIYSFRGDNLEKIFKYDRDYFEKVEEYYKNLINRTRETPQYLYYLIDAQYRSGKKKEAIANINKALKHPKPYPSIEELKKLRKRII
ncbi:MAG: hypothetical protein KHZ99_13065 [Clostridium sp.]|uniref:hypothetical protein n=1 Tax=Clostridium sp. TaxID=1506 RepID=UPI0025C55CA7|nr:hypothetical protein [Clostridium sp.]MBS4957961.1 hypothetical protein [Clostridium sp.]